MGERRQSRRQKSFLRGCVYFNKRRGALDCLIRDISERGRAHHLFRHRERARRGRSLHSAERADRARPRAVAPRRRDRPCFSDALRAGRRQPGNRRTERSAWRSSKAEIASLRALSSGSRAKSDRRRRRRRLTGRLFTGRARTRRAASAIDAGCGRIALRGRHANNSPTACATGRLQWPRPIG